MNIEERKQFLEESIKAAAEERAYQDRVAALAQPAIDKILAQHQAETSKEYPQCPASGTVLEGWKPSESTSSVDEDDPDNEDEDSDDDSDDELDAKGKSRLVAELVARKRLR